MYEVEPGRVISPKEKIYPNFDLKPRNGGEPTQEAQCSENGMAVEEVFSVIKLKPPPKKTWEPDVRAMISTPKWLSTYGLKQNRLTLDQILSTIGFKHSDDFDRALKKPVCSRYGEGLFQRYPKRNGKVYNVNVNVSKEKMKQVENSLLQAIGLYRRRIDWLTSESRRLFGVIEERCVCIVIDVKTHSPTLFDHCRSALIKVLEEQAGQDMVCFHTAALPVTRDSLDRAYAWVRQLDNVAATTNTSACEGILKAFQDRNIEYVHLFLAGSSSGASTTLILQELKSASTPVIQHNLCNSQIECVYLFSEGNSSDTAMELTLQKLKGSPLPVHTVAFNSTNSTTVKFLRDIAKITGGRFHAFAFNKLDSDVSGMSSFNNNNNNTIPGGVPPGAGTREDVVAMWHELEEARNILQDIQQIVDKAPDVKETVLPVLSKDPELRVVSSTVKTKSQDTAPPLEERSEQYMGSAEWLSKHGLRPRKLDLYDILSTCSFKHCDGVVDVKRAPHDDYTDAETINKLVGAKYCDKFCHFEWRDGSIKHVHVTADIHRQYERKMVVALQDLQRRVDWLQQGSRELFGTIIEDQVYILIDVSNSMENHLGLVKEKLFKLMQEQLRHKRRFNLVKFGSRALPWRDRMLEVNEGSLQSAWEWVSHLEVSGSTNTLAALKIALGDSETQAVYLLSDGRPDHPPKTILAQVQLQRSTPIHTISFNCNDSEANSFLSTLASDSGGRYHYYSDDMSFRPEGPVPYESEDVRLLREEMKKGNGDLIKLGQLREQCALLEWRHDDEGCGKDHGIRKRPSSATGYHRDAAQVLSRSSPIPPERPRSAHPWTRRTLSSLPTPRSHRARTATHPPKPRAFSQPNTAYHTKTSWLRLNGSLDGWVLPETQRMINEQEKRLTANKNNATKPKNKGKKKKKRVNTLQMSSRQWLKRHGLTAKKLTMLDALGGSMVRQRAKYVPILEKYVTSQVFNEIMPIAHVTNNKQEVSLVNPGAVDLKGYEEKLQAAIDQYNRRLDQVAWSGLTADERDRFGSDKPVSFQENRKDYMLSLEQLGWPVSEKDIILLEEEVEKAERYLFQSRSLRNATSNNESQSSEKRTPRIFPNANRSRDVIHDSQERVARRSESGSESGSEQEGPGDDSVGRSGSSDGSAEELGGLREEGDSDTGSKVKLAKDSSSEEDKAAMEKRETKLFKPVRKTKRSTKKRRLLRLSKGTKVIGRSMEDGLYYPGVVLKSKDARHVDVKFSSIGKRTVASRFVIATSGAKPMPKLRTGDYVLIRGLKGETEVWLPGIVQFGPKEESRQAKFYTVITYNKHKISVVRSSLIMIAQARYNFMVRYICSIHQPTKPLLLTANSDGGRPFLSPEDLNESRSGQKYPFLIRPQSKTHEAQTDTPQLRSTEVQADDTSPEDIRGILQDLRTQLSRNQEDATQAQEELRRELSESLQKREELDKVKEELRERHASLMEQHSSVQRESDRILGRHNRLKKKHVELRDRHQRTKQDKEQLTQKETDALKRYEDLHGEHSDLKTTFDKLAVDYHELKERCRELDERQVVDSSNQTEEPSVDVIDGDDQETSPGNAEAGIEPGEDDPPQTADGGEDGNEPASAGAEPQPDERLSLIGEEVLAQSPEDGWYYRGTVESATGDGYYFVADSNDTIQKIEGSQLITDVDDAIREIQVGDAVVALHPHYPFRYSPALVQQLGANLWCKLVFYDGIVADAPREEMYFLPMDRYSEVREAILSHEDKWVGHAAVVRKDDSGTYALGTIVDRINRGHHYKIEWADGHYTEQHSQHIFGAFSRRQRLALGDHVLALTSLSSLTYLPGEITEASSSKLVVQFIDGSSSDTVDVKQCFWLSEAYYVQSRDFYLDKNPPKSASSESSSSESSGDAEKRGRKQKLRRSSSSSSSSSSLSLLG